MFYSEGKAYNIVNHKMHDEDRLATAIAAKTRALNKSKKLQETEKSIRDTAVMEADLKQKRCSNRIRFNKWQEGIDRGYNPIDNTVVDVTNSTTALKIFPNPKRPATVWDKVQAPIGYGSRPVTCVSAAGRDISNGSNSNNNTNSEAPPSPITNGSGRGNTSSSARSSRSVLNSVRSYSMESARSGLGTSNGTGRRSTTANSISNSLPQLNMDRVEVAPSVSYSDANINGPPGQPIAMVRTGGFSGLK